MDVYCVGKYIPIYYMHTMYVFGGVVDRCGLYIAMCSVVCAVFSNRRVA